MFLEYFKIVRSNVINEWMIWSVIMVLVFSGGYAKSYFCMALALKAYGICFLSIVRSFDHVTLIPTFCSSFNQSDATFEVKLCRDWLKDK